MTDNAPSQEDRWNRRRPVRSTVRDPRVILCAGLTADEQDLARRSARTAGWGTTFVEDVREVAFHLPGRKVVALVIADAQQRAHTHHAETTVASLKRMQPLVIERNVRTLFLLRWHNRDYVMRLLALGVRDIVAVPADEDLITERVDAFFQTLRPATDLAA